MDWFVCSILFGFFIAYKESVFMNRVYNARIPRANEIFLIVEKISFFIQKLQEKLDFLRRMD